MEDQLSEALLDFQLETQNGGSRRRVTHIIYDPDLPPSAPPRLEVWESVKEPIGEGGQGKVLLQTCTSDGPRHNTRRALKVIRCSDDDGRRRYAREMETMVRFSHKKYSRFFATMSGWYFSKDKRDLCIAMDYFPAGDLGTYLRDRPPLSEAYTQEVIGQVLQGLALMHKTGFAHRDIKPQNILIHQHPESHPSGSWWVKLADFGISKRIDSTVTKAHIGTFTYMAPELLNPRIKAADINHQAADLWAVGVMTFYLLTKVQGFAEWRSDIDNAQTADSLLPNGQQISSDGLEFILATTTWDSSERLTCEQADKHVWGGHYIPKISVLRAPQESAPSSPSSSQRSSFSDEKEISSLSTRFTETTTRTQIGARNLPAKRDPAVEREKSITEGRWCQNERHTTSVQRGGIERGPSSMPSAKIHSQSRPDCLAQTKNVQSTVSSSITFSSSELSLDDVRSQQEQQAPPPQQVITSWQPEGSFFYTLVQDPEDQEAATQGHYQHHQSTASYTTYEQLRRLLLSHPSQFCQDPAVTDTSKGIDVSGNRGRNALNIAAERGDLEMAQALIQTGVDVNTAFPLSNSTPLMRAVKGGDLDMVRFLTKAGAHVSTVDSSGWSPLTRALADGHEEMAKLLLDCGADIKTNRTPVGLNPFAIVASQGYLDIMQRLVNLGADIHAPDDRGRNPLIFAARSGHLEAVRVLISLGADILAKDKRGNTALQEAASMGHVETVKWINDEAAKVFFARPGITSIIPEFTKPPSFVHQTPTVLRNYSRMIGSQSLGTEKDHRLFAISKRPDDLNSWGGEDCVILRKWALGTNKGDMVAAGLDHLDAGDVVAPLTSAFQAFPTLEVKFLRADLIAGQRDIVLFRFAMKGLLGSEVNLDESATLKLYAPSERPLLQERACQLQLYHLEWREVPKPLPAAEFANGQRFQLFLQKDFTPNSADDESTRRIVGDNGRFGDPYLLADLNLTGPWDKPGAFHLRIERRLNLFGFEVVTITALIIWNRYTDERTSSKYLREVLGYGNKGVARKRSVTPSP